MSKNLIKPRYVRGFFFMQMRKLCNVFGVSSVDQNPSNH